MATRYVMAAPPEREGLFGSRYVADLEGLLAVAAMFYRRYGYTNKETALKQGIRSTAHEVLGWYGRYIGGTGAEEPIRDDLETAGAALVWAHTLHVQTRYAADVRRIATSGQVGPDKVGLATSIVHAWENAIIRATKASATNRDESLHVGQIGQRGVWCGVYFDDAPHSSTTRLYRWCVSGNLVTSSGPRDHELVSHGVYWLAGTVAKHMVIRGTALTHLSDCHVSTDRPTRYVGLPRVLPERLLLGSMVRNVCEPVAQQRLVRNPT